MQLKVHVGKEEIMALAEPWRVLQHHPNSDLEHFLLLCDLRREVIAPVAFSYWIKNECVGIVCGRIERSTMTSRLGYLKLPALKAKSLRVIHEGILGEVKDESDKLIRSIIALGKQTDCDVVSFYHLPERFCALWDYLGKVKLTVGARRPSWVTHRAVTLEGAAGFLLARMSSKHRSWIRRKERALNEAFEGRIRWVWHARNDLLDEVCQSMEDIARTTYQRGLGNGFINNYETHKRLELFAQRGQLRAMILEAMEEPLSFWYGMVYKNVRPLQNVAIYHQ